MREELTEQSVTDGGEIHHDYLRLTPSPPLAQLPPAALQN